MAMKNIAGLPVRGENFLERPVLIDQFYRKIESGSSILISALLIDILIKNYYNVSSNDGGYYDSKKNYDGKIGRKKSRRSF